MAMTPDLSTHSLMAGPWTSSLALFEDSGVPAPDWVALGLACAILGCFLVANAILFRHPRRLVREFFGTVRPRLHSIRDYIFHRSQTHLGFFYLMLGFGLQLYGRLTPAQASASSQPALPVIWVGILILSAAVLEGLSWWWSRRLFRRYVRAQLAFKPHDFDGDMATAVEVGELFERDRIVRQAARLEDAAFAIVQHGEGVFKRGAAIVHLLALGQHFLLPGGLIRQPVLPFAGFHIGTHRRIQRGITA